MRELNIKETNDVEGGLAPIIGAAVIGAATWYYFCGGKEYLSAN